jgi:two-component system chemotaxis response regulator CheY
MATATPSPTVLDPAPSAPGRATATVLAIDGDAVSRRFIELALGRDPDFQVEGANDGAGALEILSRTPVHLIVADTDFTDMNGLQFYRRLNQETRLRSVPFVFLSADGRVTTKVVAFNAGVDEYLVKPCDGVELLARAKALVGRQRRIGSVLRTRGYTLAGDLSALSFPDLIAILELGRRSGTVSLASGELMGAVYFDRGRVVHALFGSLVGVPAFVWLMAREEGHFEFTPGRCPIEEPARTIHESVSSLMMESARIIDTDRATNKNLIAFGADTREVPVSVTQPAQERASAFLPDPGVAAQLEHAILDTFSLADLMIFSQDELARWTERVAARERFHVVLVCDLAQGVSAMLTLAGAPTERWVLRSLSPDAKAVGLAFFLRHERLVDVVLIDIRDPGVFRSGLRRHPSLFIVAPPDGDALALGIKARVDLSLLVADLAPRAVLGLGNPALEGALRALGLDDDVPLRCLPGALGEPPADLRPLLAEGIRLSVGAGGKAP